MPLMALGQFIFEIRTAPYQELRRRTEYRWASQPRIGARPAHQYLGPGEDTITLTGTLYPELTGGPVQLNEIRAMAAQGKAWIMMAGNGDKLGHWFIESVEETNSLFFADGTPRKIEFQIALKLDDTEDPANLGSNP